MDNDQANDGRMAGVYFFFSVFIGRKKQKGNGPVDGVSTREGGVRYVCFLEDHVALRLLGRDSKGF